MAETYIEFNGKPVTVEYFLEHVDDNKKNIFNSLVYLDRTEAVFVLKLSHIRNLEGFMWYGTHYLQIEYKEKYRHNRGNDIRFRSDENWDQRLVRELLKFKDMELKLEGLVLEHV
jgi:hypothetical protein